MDSIFPATAVTRADLLDLCGALDMPGDVRAQIDACLRGADLTPYDQHFAALLSPQSAAAGLEAFAAAVPPETGWIVTLIAHLTAALHRKPVLYDARGIPNPIFLDTMGCFTRFVREHMASFGRYGFDRAFWTWRQINGLLFRLGTLEFEMVRLSNTGMSRISPPAAEPDAPILSVHIPSDAALTREALDASYLQARVFFRDTHPLYRYVMTGCSSWLLAPRLKTLLRPDSGILRFQADYEILHENPDADDAMTWVYKRPYARPEDLPEDTSLQRGLKSIMIAGGHLGSGTGILRPGLV